MVENGTKRSRSYEYTPKLAELPIGFAVEAAALIEGPPQESLRVNLN
jgi:hypothetical protein